MKLSAQEAYGLRCLLLLARCGEGENLTIPEIGKAEGLSVSNAAKLMRMLRMRGLVESVRGQTGGYTLTRPPENISVAMVLELLGGPLFGPAFCDRHSGIEEICTHTVNCPLRSLWSTVEMVLSEVLEKTSLADLVCDERQMSRRMEDLTGNMRPLRQAAISKAGLRGQA